MDIQAIPVTNVYIAIAFVLGYFSHGWLGKKYTVKDIRSLLAWLDRTYELNLLDRIKDSNILEHWAEERNIVKRLSKIVPKQNPEKQANEE